jgi:bifunctional non-homologous end joining protein LigD
VQRRGLEGLVAKDDGSPYVGGPTRSWLKVKVRQEGQFHIGAIRFDSGEFAGLLVGQRVGRRLRFVGTVELGFIRAAVEDLLVRSHALRRSTSPFGHRGAGRRVVWLEPELLAEISYTGVLRDRLREPVFRWLVSLPQDG